ncbi:MAG TPA: hypothetical protein VFI56_26335, partial [Vicinamibacterales bacterium]|nr:hypothetical protein [Vicinamibacterales bacterium]
MTLFERSTAAFASYAAFFAPHLPADELSALQVRLWRWQVELFGTSDDRELVLLTVEGCRQLNRVIDDSAVSRVLVC